MSDCQGTVVARGSNYVLPTASSSILGGVKVGGGLAISDAVLSATGVTPTDATTTTKGIVQITAGNGLGVASGVLSQGNLQSYATVDTPLTLSSNTIGIATANASTTGALTSTDWTTFNSKQAAITGAATTITSTNLTNNRALISNASGKVAESSVTDTQLGYLSSASSNIQTQIDSKQATITGGATTITSDNLGFNKALASNGSGKVVVSAVSDTELGYLSGVTSAIQTQINSISGGVGSGGGQQTETVITTLPTTAAQTVTYKAGSGGSVGTASMTITTASPLGNGTFANAFFLYVQEQNVSGAALTGTGIPIPTLILTANIVGNDIECLLVKSLTAQASGTYTLVSANAYTIPASVNFINVEMVGAGGGGGGGYSGNNPYIASGGGAGCYGRGKIAVTAGTTYYYSVGSGGVKSATNTGTNTSAGYGRPTMFTNASMSQYMIALGGEGGNTPTLNSNAIAGAGKSTLHTAGFSDFLSVGGGDATWHAPVTSNNTTAGSGGNSFFGGGGRGANSNPLAANNGKAYGAGGGGGRFSDGAAGDGAQGVLCIKYLSNTFLSTVYTPQAPLSFSGSNLVYSPTYIPTYKTFSITSISSNNIVFTATTGPSSGTFTTQSSDQQIVPPPGTYVVSVNISVSNVANTSTSVQLKKNGSTVAASYSDPWNGSSSRNNDYSLTYILSFNGTSDYVNVTTVNASSLASTSANNSNLTLYSIDS